MLTVEKLRGKQYRQNCIVFQTGKALKNKEIEENMDKLRFC